MSSLFSALGIVTGLYSLFLLALVVTSHHDRRKTPTAFAGAPTHVRVLRDDPQDPRRSAQPEHMTYHRGTEAA
jgi:hypothetical protein